MTSIVSFIVVIGILIFVHEFGHFLLAKLLGVGVEKFSLGFGPKLLGKKIGMTEYRISAIPLGGYVKLVGESPDTDMPEEQRELSFSHKSVGRRILIVAAGPFFNLFLAILIFFSFFMISGLPVLLPEIGSVQVQVAHWTFDEGEGQTVSDASGNWNDGTLQGPTWSSGQLTGGLKFDGIDDYVCVEDSSALDLRENFTIATWVRFDALPCSPPLRTPGIVQKGESASSCTWFFGVDTYYDPGNPKLCLKLKTSGSFKILQGSQNVTVDEWHHIAAVRNGGSVQFYIDGKPDPSVRTISPEPIDINNEPLYIGNGPGNGDGAVDGLIDDLRIYNYALTDVQIADLAARRELEKRPAEKAGLQPNDCIASINGEPVESWDDMAALVRQSNGRPLTLEVYRGKKIIYLEVVPELVVSQNLFGEDVDRYVIGITPGRFEIRSLNPFQAFGESLFRVWGISRLTYEIIVKMIQGKLSIKESLGGPIMIAQMAGEHAEAGIVSLISFIALLSITLGLLNLLPIPVLDGGHLVFFFIEAVMRKPVSIKVRENAQRVGYFILGLLVMYVIYNDIMRVFFE